MNLQQYSESNGSMDIALGGFTLVEMSIAVVILSALLFLVNKALFISDRKFDEESARLEISITARRIVDRIAEEIKQSSRTNAGLQALPISPAFASSVTFNINTGYNGGIIWSTPITYRAVMDENEILNGLDDDGDGYIDEQRIEREQDGDILWIAHNIQADTFRISQIAGTIRIEVTVGRRLDADTFYTSTASTEVSPKND